MLDQITPLILTRDEEPNIERTLRQLTWAKEVLVVDSFSEDGTIEIARRFPNVRVVQRTIDTLASQWTFAIDECAVATPWVLTLDADYFVTDELVRELSTLQPGDGMSAYCTRFTYAVFGRRLRGALYPPRAVLLRRGRVTFRQDGHAQRERVDGGIGHLQTKIVHDDRKSMARWLARQKVYMDQEAAKLLDADPRTLSLPNRLRRMRVVAPFLVFLYTLIGKGCILDGWPGFHYVLERTVAEAILSMALIERDLGRR